MSVTPTVRPREADKPPVSSMSARDIVFESFAGMFARPGRMLLTVLGTTIGLTALVATLGLSRTAGQQIIGRFDELAATEITVSSLPAEEGRPSNDLPWDASRRVARLNGVVAAGTLTAIDVGGVLVSGSAVQDPLNRSAFKLPVEAASPCEHACGPDGSSTAGTRVAPTWWPCSVRTLPSSSG